MSALVLTRARLLPGAQRDPRFLARTRRDDGYHALTWSLFRDDEPHEDRAQRAQRTFLYRADFTQRALTLYALADRAPVDRDGLFELQSRPFAPALHRGDLLAYSLRANPTRSVSPGAHATKPGLHARGKRHDVVMDARKRHEGDALRADEVVQRECAAWLARKGTERDADGTERELFTLVEDTARADAYQQHTHGSAKRSGAKAIRYSSVDLSGVLRVTDPAGFLARVAAGFGAQRAFGCGLMLLRPARADEAPIGFDGASTERGARASADDEHEEETDELAGAG